VSWFRRYADIVWLDYDADDLVERAVASVLTSFIEPID
jgi:hypothetical protein